MTDIERRLNKMAGRTSSIEDRLSALQNYGKKPSSEEEKVQGENILFTPAKDGFFEGLAILPSSPQQALKDMGYTAERLGAGLLGAVEGVTDLLGTGIGKAVQGITSVGGLFPNAVSEWGGDVAEHFLNTSPTQTWENSIRERYNPSAGAENLSGVGQTIAQMLPAIGVGSAISAGGSALNAAQAASRGANAGRAIMGAQAAGNAASEAYREGADTNQALAYGVTSGLLETTIESIAGGIPGLGRGKIGEITDALMANPIVSRALDIAGEGGEEALSTALTPYLQRAIYDPDAENATAEEIAQSAVLGAVAAGVLQGGLVLPTAISNTVSDARNVRQAIGSNQDIVNRANQQIAQDLQARREAVNPLLSRFPSADEVRSGQTGRDNRLVLPGNEQNNTAPERLHEVLTASESGTPLFQSESTSQGADVPLRNDMPLGEPEGSPTVSSIPFREQNVNTQGVSPEGQQDNRLILPGTEQNNTAPVMGAGDAAASVPSAGETNAVSQLRPNGSEADGTDQIVSTVRDKVNQIVLDNLNKGKGYADILAISDEIVSLMPDNLSNAGTVFSDLLNSGRYGVTATGEMYQVDPARHIDNREIQEVGDRGIKAFQFENPQLHDYFVEAARALKYDLSETAPGERFYLPGNMYDDRPMQGTWSGVKRKTSEGIAQLKDNWHMSYKDIEKAADAIINDSGQENYAAAKRVEIILDDMLTNGYRSPMGEWNPPNEAYIQAKSKLPGAYIPDSSVENDPLPLDIPYRPEQETSPVRPESSVGESAGRVNDYGPNTVGAAQISPWGQFQASATEFFPEGANAAREVDMPTTDPQGRPIRKTAATAMGAGAIPEEALADIQNMVLRGELSYDRVSDKASINRAIKTIQNKGYQGALEEFRSDIQRGVVSKDIATLGQQLLVNAANAGDSRTTAELLSLYAQMETTAGQAVQAASILRKLDPSDQLYAAQRAVSDLEKVLRKNYKDLDITIDQALLDEFAAQTTQEGRDAVMDRIYQNVADQVPSTWRDKWNAWRYLAMLANPRTHIRNVAGNLFFQPLRIVKDRTAAAIEAGLSKAGVNIERTKSFAASPDLYKAAWSDWQNVKDVLSGNKYDDVRSEINSRRRVFRTAPLEAARTGNSWALEFEDSIFKRITYADALAGYLQANGVSAEQVRNNTVDAQLMARARDYAGQEALRATYQDRNMVSNKVVEVARALGPFGEAVLPFKRTPANILVRGLEYSPAGLAKALTADLVQVKQGKISAAQAIDHIAAGLTGSALFALGAYLFSEGLVTSGGGDDENQDRINDLTGQQNYALNLPGGGNVTLDWLAPEALPFFMGVELMDSLGQNGNTSESIMNALQSISEPMLELSMLQSLNDIIDSVSFSENKLGAMAASSVISYFTQAVPTIGGQVERSLEDTRMSTYTDKNLKLPTDVQYALGRASARIPLPYVDYQQVPYIDAWGRREDSGPLWLRTANNFLNPAYTSNSEVTPVDEEIQRLYDETGESGVVPDRPQRYITVDGERIDLSAEQYTQYAEERGQMQFSMLEGLVDSSAYQRLSDTDKAAIVSDVYSYADAVTKSHISDYEPEGWIAKVVESGADPAEYILYKHSLTDGMTLKERSAALERSGITGREKTNLLLAENPEWTEKAREYGVSDRVYVEFKVATSDVSADKDEDGKSVSGSKKKKVMDIIDGMDVSDEVKDSLYYAAGYTESTIDDAPWR